MSHQLWVVEDDDGMRQLLEEGMARRGFQVTCWASADAALAHLSELQAGVLLTDLRMKGTDGLSLAQRVAADRPDVPVVLMTAFGNVDAAVAALRAGVADFVIKPLELDALTVVLQRAIENRGLRDEVKRLREQVQVAQLDELLGDSPPMVAVRALIARIAATEASVLVTGETGTGKEVVARAIHRSSPRAKGPFVAINCAAMPPALLESELFGHARGAFTDARVARPGLLLQATGGTLFLDELGELPLEVQPKLLRALQERTARPVGGSEEVAFDLRLICATNTDLEAAVEEKRFREDLYFRVNVIQVPLPPLRLRGNDVLLLAQTFIRQLAAKTQKQVEGLSSEAAQRLLAWPWPGNVRELHNAMERAVALTSFNHLRPEDLPDRLNGPRDGARGYVADDGPLVPLETVERQYILRVLEATGGHRTQAARVLGLDRKTLYRKLERYGVPPGSGE